METLLAWVVERVAKFPREHKFTVGDRLIETCLDITSHLVEASYRRDKHAELTRAGCVKRAQVPHAPPETARVLGAKMNLHGGTASRQHEAEERDGLARAVKPALRGMKPKPELIAAQHDGVPRGTQAPWIVIEYKDVIAIADEAAELQVAGEQMIDGSEHQIGPDLRGQVPDRQPVWAIDRREQIIAGKVESRWLDMARGIDDLLGDGPPRSRGARVQQALEDRVVDRREELREIEPEHVVVTAGQLGGRTEAAVRAQTHSACVGLRRKRALDRGQGRIDEQATSTLARNDPGLLVRNDPLT
jgi:hypothetical protein